MRIKKISVTYERSAGTRPKGRGSSVRGVQLTVLPGEDPADLVRAAMPGMALQVAEALKKTMERIENEDQGN